MQSITKLILVIAVLTSGLYGSYLIISNFAQNISDTKSQYRGTTREFNAEQKRAFQF